MLFTTKVTTAKNISKNGSKKKKRTNDNDDNDPYHNENDQHETKSI